MVTAKIGRFEEVAKNIFKFFYMLLKYKNNVLFVQSFVFVGKFLRFQWPLEEAQTFAYLTR